MNELQGPVVGEVLVLLSVFIPTAFISGITGQLYKQFALTIAVSTAFSGFNALTFTPAMCALFLKPRTGQPKFFLYRWFNAGFGKVLPPPTNDVPLTAITSFTCGSSRICRARRMVTLSVRSSEAPSGSCRLVMK